MSTLDYFRGIPAYRRAARTPWLRVMYSHRARLELARTASVGQGFALLAGIALVSSLLSLLPLGVQAGVRHVQAHQRDATVPLWPGEQVWGRVAVSAGKAALVAIPSYFGVLCAGVTLVATLWTCLRKRRPWTRCFPAMAVASVPLLWLMMVMQLEGLAPLTQDQLLGSSTAWNPLTNSMRFWSAIATVALLGVWAMDVRRLYVGLDGPAGDAPPAIAPSKAEEGVVAMTA